MRDELQLIDDVASGATTLAELVAYAREVAKIDPSAIEKIYAAARQRYREGSLAEHWVSEIDQCLRLALPPVATHDDESTRYQRQARPSREAQIQPRPAPPPAEKVPVPGALIMGRFRLLEKIGEGGMGIVFKARDEEFQGQEQLVAIKFLNDELRGRPEAIRQLQEEVRKSRDLAHPNVVTMHDFYREDSLCFIAMEYLEGEPLDKYLRRSRDDGLPFAKAWPIIQGAGAALTYAHQLNIIHSDFKPGNVFITRDGRTKVLDFGLARAVRSTLSEADEPALSGYTPGYASPEMVLSLAPDPRDDVFGLACVAYELLAGRHPFKGKPAHVAQHEGAKPARIRGLPPHKMRALANGLAFTRDARTTSVEALLNDLANTKTPWPLYAGAAAVVAAVAAAAGGMYLYSEQTMCADADTAFVEALRSEAAASTNRPDANYHDTLLELGNDYLASATAGSFSGGEALRAFNAFKDALRTRPDSEGAVSGILRTIASFESETERLLSANDATGAASTAETGLRLHPGHCGLKTLSGRAAALLP